MQIRDVVNRLGEPSSHAGFAAAAQLLKVVAPQWGVVFDCLTALFAALAVAIPETKKGSAA